MSWIGWFFGVVVGAGALTLGCAGESTCDAVGCASGFEIHATSIGPLANGRYRIELTLDEVTGTCEVLVPPGPEAPTCGDLPVSVHAVPNGIVVGILAAPRAVAIRIEDDTDLLTEERYEPEYEVVRPAGPGCPARCRVAGDQTPYLSAAVQAYRRRGRETAGDYSCDFLYACGVWTTNDYYRCRSTIDDDGVSSGTPSEFEQAIFEGRIVYDERAAEECRSLGSSCILGDAGVCMNRWEGSVPTDGACTLSAECAGLARCQYTSDFEDTGRCVPLLEPGEPCTPDLVPQICVARGAERAACIDVNGESQCRASVPLPDGPAGSRCGAWLEEDELVQAGCMPGNFCSDEGSCTPFRALGEPCALNSNECGNEAECWGTCVPIVTRDQEGDSCGYGEDVIEDCNPEWLACLDGICEAKGDGSKGSICDDHPFFNDCNAGLECPDGHCVVAD